MNEEGQIAPQSDYGDDDDLADETSVLDDLASPEEEHIVQRAMGLVMGVVGPAGNPLLRRFTSNHITLWLNNRENDARRSHSAANFERWMALWFGTLILATAVGLIVFFGIREPTKL